MNDFLLPAERWETIADAYSAHIAVEHKGNKPLPVRTAEHCGFLYTAFAVMHGPWGGARKPTVDAYRLLPEPMYNGETTRVYHDDEAIRAGLRNRGDHTGLIVSVGGKLMVCASKVRFAMDVPGTRPMSITEAKTFDDGQRAYGWRSFWYGDSTPEWFSLRGHPVVRYRNDYGEVHATLFWKSGREIHEMSIADDVGLSPPDRKESTVSSAEEQLSLF